MESSRKQNVTPEIRAQASAWIARLHGPQRDSRTETGFRNWLSADPAHARAFEQTTEAWDAISGVPSEKLSSMVRWDRVGSSRTPMKRYGFALAASIVIAVCAAGLHAHLSSVTTTQVGEQRSVTLRDGTRVHLNTSSRLRTRYTEQARQIELEAGEALFEVARRPGWPFVVVAGDRRITALGTSFVVRRDPRRIAVTLVEGGIVVAATQPGDTSLAARSTGEVLKPGERVTFVGTGQPTVDRPALERVTAWQRGLVILDGTPLREAITEMNRYSSVPLQVENTESAALRISGAFRAGDSLSFAQAVAVTYRLKVVEQPERIVLQGRPQATY